LNILGMGAPFHASLTISSKYYRFYKGGQRRSCMRWGHCLLPCRRGCE
jgi:hypothetical protein